MNNSNHKTNVAKSPQGGFSGLLLLVMMVCTTTCKRADSIYEEYIVPNGLSYPGIVVDAEAHPGKNRIEIAWKNGADPKVVKARIFWNNYTDTVEVAIDPEMKAVTNEIKPMEEDTYSFFIQTYDAKGNVSVPVEVTGTVYGENYQRSLINRALKSALYNTNASSLDIKWDAADATETGMELYYTDVHDNPKSLPIDRSETAITIADLKVGEPVFYLTTYKPDSLAIDLFQTPKVQIPYLADITAQTLENAKPPFSYGARTIDVSYVLLDWIITPASLSANGNYDAGTIIMYAGYGNSRNGVTNGKFYQTVELDAGEYTFNTFIGQNNNDGNIMFLVVDFGDGLPDTNNVEQDAFKYTRIPTGIAANSNRLFSINFTLSEKKTVSLGFAIDLPIGSLRIVRVLQLELLKQF